MKGPRDLLFSLKYHTFMYLDCQYNRIIIQTMIDAGKRLWTLSVSLLSLSLIFGMKKGDPVLLQESKEGPQ